jgi:hypothetical protein
LPNEPCNVHGEQRARLVKDTEESGFPKAASAIDLTEISVVIPKSGTLLADKDPYNSVRAVVKATPAPEIVPEPTPEPQSTAATPATASRTPPPPDAPVMKALPANANATPAIPSTPPPDAPVKKALPVRPSASQTPAEIRKAVPVGPLDEESDESLLNRAATPPPAKLDE